MLAGRVGSRALLVYGTLGRMERVRVLGSDRAANGDAFDGERPVRLPRRFSRHYGALIAGTRTR